MAEYIAKEQAIGVVKEAIGNIINSDSELVNLVDLEIEIEMTITDYTDTADVVEVVRCKDCENYIPLRADGRCIYWDNRYVYEDDFCSYSHDARMDGGESDD